MKNINDFNSNFQNQFLDGKLIAKEPYFLSATGVNWWDINQGFDYKELYANYFDDENSRTIGDSKKFNGKIVSLFRALYCYLFVECWPRKN